jgi:hypothetical protein
VDRITAARGFGRQAEISLSPIGRQTHKSEDSGNPLYHPFHRDTLHCTILDAEASQCASWI